MTLSRLNLDAFSDSPYADELRRGFPDLRFDRELETDYVRLHLQQNRTLIRVASLMSAAVAGGRLVEQLIAGAWARPVSLSGLVLVLLMTAGLLGVAWSRAYERSFMACATVLVPARNLLIGFLGAAAVARGQLDMLMILPIAVVGGFFFWGLRLRAALVSGIATVAAFGLGAYWLALDPAIALRASIFLAVTLLACAVACRHIERSSRTAFLETHLIAELAEHDPLTGMKNRRVFDAHLARVWTQAATDQRTIALLLFDVDHFKSYNDRYGHQAGDETLRSVAQALDRHVSRPLDLLARYGGEEFVAILYDIDISHATALAEQMRGAVEDLCIDHRGSRSASHVTISVGVAVIAPASHRHWQGAFQLADQALYRAKVEGRNRVALLDQAEYGQLVTGVFEREHSRTA